MNKLFKILGILAIVAAAALGYFDKFDNSAFIEVCLGAFGLCSLIVTNINEAKAKENFSWKTVVILALAVVAGVLCCLGGLSQNIFAEVSAAVLALMTLIFGLLFNKK